MSLDPLRSLDPAPSLVDPDTVGARPQTARGRRTRDSLVQAARVVFERDGWVASRLVDIAAEAGCSIGSFYTWFDGKDEVLAAVLQAVQEDMLHPGTGRFEAQDDPVAVIAASNRAYFEAFRRNARLMALLQQVAAVDPRFRDLRRARSEAFVARNARAIADLQQRGLADRAIDPQAAAKALSGMVSRLAHDVFAFGDDEGVDELVETATRLWTNALGLTTPQLRTD